MITSARNGCAFVQCSHSANQDLDAFFEAIRGKDTFVRLEGIEHVALQERRKPF